MIPYILKMQIHSSPNKGINSILGRVIIICLWKACWRDGFGGMLKKTQRSLTLRGLSSKSITIISMKEKQCWRRYIINLMSIYLRLTVQKRRRMLEKYQPNNHPKQASFVLPSLQAIRKSSHNTISIIMMNSCKR